MWTQAEALWGARLEGRLYLLSQMSETELPEILGEKPTDRQAEDGKAEKA